MLKQAFYTLAAGSALLGVSAADTPTSLPYENSNGEVIECQPGAACWNMVFMAWLVAQQQPKGRSGNSDPNKQIFRDFRTEFIVPAVANDTVTETKFVQSGSQPSGRFGAKIPIRMVANYGCWCYGGSSWPTGSGRSSPVDAHDDACKAHSMGMKCISTDAKYEQKECEPYLTDYDVTITQDGYGALLMECSDSIEEDWCRRRVCMVELRLLARYWNLLDSGVWPNYQKWAHPNIKGPFDPMVECPPSGGTGDDIEMRCCGDYPYRSWYFANPEDDKSGTTQCCVYQDDKINQEYGFAINIGKIFNQFTNTCTDAGVV